MSPDVALLTDARWEGGRPAADDAYFGNIMADDGLVIAALARCGIRAVRVDWARPDFDWGSVAAAVFRTTWDYFDRFAEFSRWLERAALLTRLINPVELVRWNVDKRYLLDLRARGLPVLPTVVLERGDRCELARELDRLGWPEIVLKPAVSGAARHTYRLDRVTAPAFQPRLDDLLAREAMLIQPFQRSVLAAGELALVVIEGEVTHAVRKRARSGDFRVQDDHGGTVHPHEPSAAEVDLARRAVAACRPAPAYARVDVIDDDHDAPCLMEVELVEPELFFRRCPPAADAFAQAIARRLAAPGA